MSRHQWGVCMRDQRRNKGNEQRHHNRQTRNLWKNIGPVILSHHTGPTGQRIDFTPPVMTRIEITARVEVKTTGLGLLKVKKTGVTYKPSNEVNHNEKAGNPYSYTCSHTRLWTGTHV
jgi:hypothetical protein